ncbi:MAG: hypothetical protein A2358_02870 [Candidatus Staskawiczbacteria bacterium RIFOXYB1_FULL_37_44]|uniref:Uncharacterized protein n=1 Tax=Candidatus Staskawiczbacteria bacterium RIFOXYB1_FULL_37_44 TaxID=1802223 RepID=A0A1G2IV06_9BACT|nr:MAG: hypothetical protein A2358_02870 [Candidatus Staskawiczbacteria bacterium RIFOXYB1_FULL_37_44]OGZ83867.1 MAG: hypothetical protein A2416_02585 [Candidatus Staskawiczbacteria bacterium RIFOXYC1_FULL_37_52]OGZ89374.1 MAG: hypothetical protein A2581_00645 [Candidatus Staskawiczbacteria bacterium RIFOXYD1_FULL_37_110]
MNNKVILIVVSAIALLLIAAASCFYVGFLVGGRNGFIAGKEQGFKDGQKATLEIRDMANPYAELEAVANPFQQEYENPF